MHRRCLSWVAGLVLAFTGSACGAHGVIVVNEPWVRVAPGGHTAEAYMRLTSSEGAKLVSATSVAAAQVVMRGPDEGRRKVDEVALPAGRRMELARGRIHLQLVGLTRKFGLGDRVPLTLVIRSGDGVVQEVPVDAEVRLHSPTEDESHPHHHPAGHAH